MRGIIKTNPAGRCYGSAFDSLGLVAAGKIFLMPVADDSVREQYEPPAFLSVIAMLFSRIEAGDSPLPLPPALMAGVPFGHPPFFLPASFLAVGALSSAAAPAFSDTKILRRSKTAWPLFQGRAAFFGGRSAAQRLGRRYNNRAKLCAGLKSCRYPTRRRESLFVVNPLGLLWPKSHNSGKKAALMLYLLAGAPILPYKESGLRLLYCRFSPLVYVQSAPGSRSVSGFVL